MAVTVSIEIELGWGVHDVGEYPHLSADGEAERAALARLLDRCDEVDVPISFDVVGHLFEEECEGAHDGPYPAGWFDSDPGTDAATDPLFYAPEVVREIRDRPTDHEICTHTYSHVLCNVMSEETVARDLERAQSVHRETIGSETASIVPPRHSRPPSATLREGGIEVMRMSRDTSDRGKLSRLREVVDGPHPVYEPALVDGVVETYCTTYPSLASATLPSGQERPMRPFRVLPVRLRQRLHRRYLRRALDAAESGDGDCHLWCHLYDISNDYQWPGVSWFLGELADRRDRGELEVRTMAELNEAVRAERGGEQTHA